MPANENMNQNAHGVWQGNDVQVHSGTTDVNFNNNAHKDCTVTFGNPETFDISSVTVLQQSAATLTIIHRLSTTITLPDSDTKGPQYTISVDTD